MELIISIISCIATVGSLIIAVISLIKSNKTQKELSEYKHNKVTQQVKDNTGINVGFNGGVINEKK